VASSLYVSLRHADGIETTYSFLSRIDVAQGDQIAQGQSIGLSGEGHPGESHALHFGAKLNDEYIDPLSLLVDFNNGWRRSPVASFGSPGVGRQRVDNLKTGEAVKVGVAGDDAPEPVLTH